MYANHGQQYKFEIYTKKNNFYSIYAYRHELLVVDHCPEKCDGFWKTDNHILGPGILGSRASKYKIPIRLTLADKLEKIECECKLYQFTVLGHKFDIAESLGKMRSERNRNSVLNTISQFA